MGVLASDLGVWGFGVQGVGGFEVWGLGFGAWRFVGVAVQGLSFVVYCVRVRSFVSGIGGPWFRVYGLGVLSVGFEGSWFGFIVPLLIFGDLIVIYPQPYSIYLRGTIP